MKSMTDWKTVVQPMFEKVNFDLSRGLLQELTAEPLSTSENEAFPAMASTSTNFYNIIPFQKDTWADDFSKSGRAGVFIENEWPDSLTDQSLFIYLQASPHMSSFKKALLKSDKFKKLNLGIDPYSLGLWKSTLYKSHLDTDFILQALEKNSQLFRITTQSYALAGASDVQQLAIVLASMVQLIEDYEGLLTVDQVMSAASVELSLNSHLFVGLAKVRSCQLLLARLSEIFTWKGTTSVYGVPSVRFMSAREPWNNILRLTSMAAISRMGGLQGFVSLPYDMLSREPKGYRTSSRVPEILEMESHLGRVTEPALGSATLESLTHEMCEKAWSLFREIQKKEGILSSLRSGWLPELITEKAQRQNLEFLNGDLKIVGGNRFPLLESLSTTQPLVRKEKCYSGEEWWITHYDENEAETLCNVARLIPRTLCQEYENWQFRADQLSQSLNQRVTVKVFAEDSVKDSKKQKVCEQILSLAGLKTEMGEDVESASALIGLVVASDPDGEFVKKFKGNDKLGLKLWAGERKLSGFDDFVGVKSDKRALFEKVFNLLGREI